MSLAQRLANLERRLLVDDTKLPIALDQALLDKFSDVTAQATKVIDRLTPIPATGELTAY